MGKTVIELVLPAVSLITFAMQSNSFLPQGPSQGFTVIRKSLNPHAAVEILNDLNLSIKKKLILLETPIT